MLITRIVNSKSLHIYEEASYLIPYFSFNFFSGFGLWSQVRWSPGPPTRTRTHTHTRVHFSRPLSIFIIKFPGKWMWWAGQIRNAFGSMTKIYVHTHTQRCTHLTLHMNIKKANTRYMNELNKPRNDIRERKRKCYMSRKVYNKWNRLLMSEEWNSCVAGMHQRERLGNEIISILSIHFYRIAIAVWLDCCCLLPIFFNFPSYFPSKSRASFMMLYYFLMMPQIVHITYIWAYRDNRSIIQQISVQLDFI